MTTIALALARAVRLGADGRGRFEAGPELQSWPGIVHGGGLVAALDEAALRLGAGKGARRIEARLTSSVPAGPSVALEGYAREGMAGVSLLDDGQPLTTATVSALGPEDGSGAPAWAGGTAGWPLPMSEQCLACGAANPLGLQVRLAFDDDGVWARLTPRESWRAAGALHPALAPVALDEVAWWLGALVMKEGGLTNRISVALLDPGAPVDGEVVAAGRFEEVAPVDRRRTFWRTAVTLGAGDGRLLARAAIVFRGGPEYSARQLDYFQPRTAPGVFRRMFPNYAR